MPKRIYDFDRVISRTGTDSIKWRLYPEDVLPLWVADMDFASPPEIIGEIQNRLAHPIFGYAGEDFELKEIICGWILRRHAWKVEPEQVVLLNGVVTGLNWVTLSVLSPGERLSFQTPVYPPFFKISDHSVCELLEIPLVAGKDRYEIDFDAFESMISKTTRLFILCNPHNPVGRVFSRVELERIGEICLRKRVLICSDEIHCDLVYSGNTHIPIALISPELAQNTVTLMAPSKTFNIPGLNFSFAVIQNTDLRKQMMNSCRGILGTPSLLANAAARGAFNYGESWVDQVCRYLESNRDFLLEFIKEKLPIIKIFKPQGTYLAWLDCREMKYEKNAYQFFLENAKVALNDGNHFGANGSGFVRLNFGCPKSILIDALERIEKSISILS